MAVSRGTKKAEMAKGKGADFTVDSTDPASIEASPKCDIILNTVSANHDLNVYLPLLAKNGNLVQLGAAPAPHGISQLPLMFNRYSVSGSLIGGIKATQECVNFCH